MIDTQTAVWILVAAFTVDILIAIATESRIKNVEKGLGALAREVFPAHKNILRYISI